MKGKVLIPFATDQGQFRKGQVVEIVDWSWVNGHLVEPIPERTQPETAVIEPAERAVSRPKKRRRSQS